MHAKRGAGMMKEICKYDTSQSSCPIEALTTSGFYTTKEFSCEQYQKLVTMRVTLQQVVTDIRKFTKYFISRDANTFDFIQILFDELNPSILECLCWNGMKVPR